MGTPLKAAQTPPPDRERFQRLTEGLRHLAIEADRQTEAEAIGRITSRWAAVLLESTLGVVAWRAHGATDWHVAASAQGAPLERDQPEYGALRPIVEEADFTAGIEPIWTAADRHPGWAAAGTRLGLEQWAAARALQGGRLSVLVVVGRARRRYLPADELIVLTIAQLGLRYLDRLDLQLAAADVHQARAEWETLSEVAIELAGYTDLDAVLNAVVRRCQEIAQSEVSLFFLRDEASDDLILRAFAGIRTPEFGRWTDRNVPSGYRRPVSMGYIGIAVRERRPVILPEIKLEDDPNPTRLSQELRIRSSINVPVYAGSQLVGAITVGNRLPTTFSPRLADLLATLARLAAAAIDSARRHEQQRLSLQELLTEKQASAARHARLESSVAFRDDLTAAAMSGPGLDQVIQTLADRIGRPVLVQDTGLRLLASADPRDAHLQADSTDLVWQSSDLLRLDDAQVQTQIHQLIEATLPNEPLTGPYLTTHGSRLITPILSGRSILGYLSIAEQSRSLSDFDLDAIGQAAAIVALQMLGERRAAEVTETFRAEFLRHLLAGTDQSGADLFRRARYLGHQPADQHAVVIIGAFSKTSSASDAESPLFQAEVRRLVEKSNGSVLLVPRDRRIVLLYPLRHGSRIETVRAFGLRLAGQLQASWPNATVAIGIGGIAPSLNDVKRSFDEAQLAERALSAQVGRPAAGVLAWDDLGIVKLLLQANNQAHLGQFARQVLGRLLDYDRDHGAALVETLREYFAQGNNLEGTARALHLHPHSLRYRLQRVAEIAGLDLKDADSRLNVQVALKILDLSRTARLA